MVPRRKTQRKPSLDAAETMAATKQPLGGTIDEPSTKRHIGNNRYRAATRNRASAVAGIERLEIRRRLHHLFDLRHQSARPR